VAARHRRNPFVFGRGTNNGNSTLVPGDARMIRRKGPYTGPDLQALPASNFDPPSPPNSLPASNFTPPRVPCRQATLTLSLSKLLARKESPPRRWRSSLHAPSVSILRATPTLRNRPLRTEQHRSVHIRCPPVAFGERRHRARGGPPLSAPHVPSGRAVLRTEGGQW
jgi:hypothetical protein